MADARKTWTQLDTLFANNTAGAISPQDLRDGFTSLEPHTSTSAPAVTDDGTDGFDTGHAWLKVDGSGDPTALFRCLANDTGAAVWKQVWPPLADDLDLSGTDLADLASGDATDGQVATADGSGGVAWEDAAGGGVTGPASSVDGNLAAFDGTDGGTLKDSGKAAASFATAAQGTLAGTAVQPGDDAADLGSGTATDGQVLTADGSGGAAWESAATTPSQSFVIACSDETTDLTTGTGKVTFRTPYAFTVSEVRASVSTAPTGSALTVDINEAGTSILSTKLTIDAGEKTSETAATAAVISDSALADDAEISIDIDAVGSSAAGKGLKVAIIGKPT